MSSTLTRAIRYDLHDELDELYERVAEWTIAKENHAREETWENAAAHLRAGQRVMAAFDRVEGRVAVLDSAGGHEHDEAGEVDGKAGHR